jgi:hypothetical protein
MRKQLIKVTDFRQIGWGSVPEKKCRIIIFAISSNCVPGEYVKWITENEGLTSFKDHPLNTMRLTLLQHLCFYVGDAFT